MIEEIWHLLEPGLEFFDRGKLAKLGQEILSEEYDDLQPDLIFDAWGEFLKAFSFASRSTPEFREFLRASYEAGTFQTLSNIEGVLEKMEVAITDIHREELTLRQSIEGYKRELETYQNWAINFPIN